MSIVMEAAPGIAVVRDDGDAEAGPYSISLCGAGPTVDDIWDGLFRTGLASPYQNRAFIRPYIETIARANGIAPNILLVRDGGGRPVMLMPLGLCRRGPLRIAELLGGKDANYHMPIFHPDFASAVSPATLREILLECGRLAGADLLALRNMPDSWEGAPSPLARIRHQPSPSFAYRASLKADPEATLEALRSSSSRRRLRRYLRRLEENGEVRLRRAAHADEGLELFGVYLAQKRQRMRDQRIDNVFERADVQQFYRWLIGRQAGVADGCLDFYWLQVGEDIAATWCGIHHAGRWSGMITSFDAEKYGTLHAAEILIKCMVEDLCRRGFSTFDLGIGEARYKSDWCDGTDRLIDLFVPCSALGVAGAPLLAAAYRTKRFVKQNPRLKALAMRLTAKPAS